MLNDWGIRLQGDKYPSSLTARRYLCFKLDKKRSFLPSYFRFLEVLARIVAFQRKRQNSCHSPTGRRAIKTPQLLAKDVRVFCPLLLGGRNVCTPDSPLNQESDSWNTCFPGPRGL